VTLASEIPEIAMSDTENQSFKMVADARVKWPCDMPDDMLAHVISVGKQALQGRDPGREGAVIAEAIKRQLDVKWGNHWHVVVGQHFGSHVVHEAARFVYFYVGQHALLVYKSGR
jgi:dynein light chain LC8-type